MRWPQLPLLLPPLLAALGGLGSPKSGEESCNRTGQASCGEKYIPVAWLCNGRLECSDGEDEQCEEACRGHPEAWQCDDGKCISLSWLCDGIGDCLDGSDEVNCEFSTTCPDFKTKCSGHSQCRDAQEVCNIHNAFEDGSEEALCPQSYCPVGQWHCKNKMCVADSWKCDGVNDCGDSSDEEVCASCPEDMFRCDEGKCLPESLMCDGEADCTDGADEPMTCGKNCSLLNGGCEGMCIDTHWGVRCSCAPGWQLQPDSQSCGDVDECSVAYSPCGQLCENTPGSYSCDCAPGYQLHNGTDCRVTDDAMKILIASNQGLGVLEQRTGIYEILIPTKSRPTSVAYDLERDMYFWVDEVLNVFARGKSSSVPLYSELKAVNSISLDWFTGQLYWASSFAKVIYAGLSDGRGYVKVLEKDLVPEQLVVFPAKKYMYWVNRGERGMSTIESAGMDGSDRKVLIIVTMEDPIGLTLDHVTGRLYWISNYKESIETIKVDGRGRHTFPEVFLEGEDPVGLAVFENYFFWVNNVHLVRSSSHTPKERVVLLTASIAAFSTLHKSQQPKSRYPVCVPGSCSHLCLLSPVHPKGYKCACPKGMFLLPSGSCSELKLVFSSGKRLYLLKVGFMGSSIERTLVQEHPWNIYLLDVDWKRNLIYWANAQGHLFRSTVLSRQKQEIWKEPPVCSANVDIATGNLYWLPCDRGAILKTRMSDHNTHTLHRTSSIILHLLLDWPKRVLYWVESGKHLQSMTLDGKRRQEIWSGTWTADTHMALDLGSSSILWMTKGLGVQSLSLLKNRTYTLNKTWSDGLLAAHAPYLVTTNRATLVLWDRSTLVHFSVSKEPFVRKIIILAENQDVPDPEMEEAPSTTLAPLTQAPRLCTGSSVLCQNGKECIAPEKLCDGDWDCQDGSDEKNCSQICNRPGMFQCLGGDKCIEKKFHCDGSQQCNDGSDELDCWKPVEDCSLRCDNKTRCIPKSWLCDGIPDCTDRKDEQGCSHHKCSPSEFSCESGQCILSSLHCDGKRDCPDHSDEEGCSSAQLQQCPAGQIQCQRSGECVLAEWRCDHDVDCEDGTDEKDCDVGELLCGSGQWTCASQVQCVPNSWHCDGHSDCEDSSDEVGCPATECLSSQFQCGSFACLHFTLVCDGTRDCADGSDEGEQCSQVSCLGEECDHTCYPSPQGPICACEPGFELKKGGKICKDMDECQKSEGRLCSQTCINTQGSYSCTCHPGYLLEPDGHTCKATGNEPILLVAIQFNLLLYGLRSLKEDVLATMDKNLIIFSLDYDLVDQTVFWADLSTESIQWISMDTQEKGTIITGIKADCLAVDWIGRNLYWIDGSAGQISAFPLTTAWRGNSEYTVVLDDDLNQPRSLVLDPLSGFMYWAEIGEEPQIEQAGMDGSGRKTLINQGLGRPTSIALDQLSWKIFWSDDKLHCIGSANLDGSGISLTQIQSPFSVAVFEDEIFWSEMKTRTVQHMKKATGKNRAVLIKRFNQPYGLKIIHEVLQPRSSNPCLNTRCSHLCLLSPRSKGSCHCPVGLLLADDGTNCVPLKETAFLFLVLPTVIMQIYMKHLEAIPAEKTLPEHQAIPFTNVNQFATVDYLVKEKALYLSETNNVDIKLLRLKEFGKLSWRKILSMQGTIIDFALDWLSGNIYWIDSKNPYINVASSKGQYPIVLISQNLYHPTSVVLHPPSSIMCFVDLGSHDDTKLGSTIECAFMDGSRRKVLWQKSQVPVGLAFSDSGTRIYWADTASGLIESICQDGSRYRVDRRGLQNLSLFTYGQGKMLWTTIGDAHVTKVWYGKEELSEDHWFQVDQKIMDLKVYSKLSQQGSNSCSKDNGGCSHICLPHPEGQTCKCPSGHYLVDASKCMEVVQCSEPSQSCEDGQKCIYVKQICDGRADCLDGSDEMDCTYSDQTRLILTPEKSSPEQRLTPKVTQPLLTTEPTKVRHPGPEKVNYPAKKTLTPLIPDRENKNPETMERGDYTQLKDLQRTNYLPCSSDFCNRQGICTVEGDLKKCDCLPEYGGEFCEKAAPGPTAGYRALSFTTALSLVLVALGAFVYLRREHELKRSSRTSSKNAIHFKENNHEEEILMKTENLVNEAFDEQEF